MAKNNSVSKLDPNQIFRQVYDQSNDSFRVNLGDVNGITMSLSAPSGDSVVNYPRSITVKVSLTNASTGVVIPAFDLSGCKSVQLYTNTTATITGAQVCTLQVSPSDTDSVWTDTTATVTPSTTNGTAVAGTAVTNLCARRGQVKIAAAITSGTFDLYIVLQGV